jgi:cytochrome P450
MSGVLHAAGAPPTVARLSPRRGLAALAALRHGFGGLLPVLELVQEELGDVFQLTLPGFRPVVVARPDAIRHILVDQPDAFRWRHAGDPVTRLLRRGFLVTDGELHDRSRAVVARSCRRGELEARAGEVTTAAARVLDRWRPGQSYDMLVEMRKMALLSFERVFLSHDPWPELPALWRPLLRTLRYIGPGPWIMLPRAAPPPPRAARVLDPHLVRLIRARRASLAPPSDLLTDLTHACTDDGLVRDQLLTMLIAGHDTSTAHLAWTLYLLGAHPRWMERVRDEVRRELGAEPPSPERVRRLPALQQVLHESLRLYPPIHALSRTTVADVTLAGFRVPAGTRLLVSVYLAHRHPAYWEEPSAFRPERWGDGARPHAFAYLPFGGGARNCVGAPFAQIEAPLILASILQRYGLRLEQPRVLPHMGATLTPHPRLLMRVEERQ